jgi:protein PhnA
MLCGTCLDQVNSSDTLDENHWRCLNDSMWSQVPAVQVLAYRMLNRLDADWSRDGIVNLSEQGD